MSRADVLHERAKAALNRGAFGHASTGLTRALDATRDPDLSARIELTRAYLEVETGEADAGRERCLQLLERPGLSDETYGMIWSQLGLLWMRAERTTRRSTPSRGPSSSCPATASTWRAPC